MLLHSVGVWNQDEFQKVLRQIRRTWRGWRIVLFLDRGSPHRAKGSMCLASELGIETRWLPVARPELNPVDHLWRHVKQDVLTNEPTPDPGHISGVCMSVHFWADSPTAVAQGWCAYTFWLHKVLHEHVKLLLSKYELRQTTRTGDKTRYCTG